MSSKSQQQNLRIHVNHPTWSKENSTLFLHCSFSASFVTGFKITWSLIKNWVLSLVELSRLSKCALKRKYYVGTWKRMKPRLLNCWITDWKTSDCAVCTLSPFFWKMLTLRWPRGHCFWAAMPGPSEPGGQVLPSLVSAIIQLYIKDILTTLSDFQTFLRPWFKPFFRPINICDVTI